MTKDKALDLALEVLDNLLYWDNGKSDYDQAREAITAIKQARSAPYVATSLVQEPVGWWDAKIGFFEEKHFDQLQPLYASPPAAQRPWVGLTDDERYGIRASFRVRFLETSEFAEQVQLATEAKLKEKNT
jgi:hypothetical protein